MTITWCYSMFKKEIFMCMSMVFDSNVSQRSALEIGVIPAKAGIQKIIRWIPAFAGMTPKCITIFVVMTIVRAATRIVENNFDGKKNISGCSVSTRN